MKDLIDVHAHALTREFLDAHRALAPESAAALEVDSDSISLVPQSGPRRGPFPMSFIDPAARTRDMDNGRVAMHVLSSPPFMFLYDHEPVIAAELIRILNDSLLSWAEGATDRYRVLASLPGHDPKLAVAEILRLTTNPMLAGVAIGSSIAGVDLDDDALSPVWQALTEADLPVLIHPVDPPGSRLGRYFMRNTVGNPIETTIAASCLIFGGVLEQFPTLRICLVHGGGFVPYQLGRFTRGYQHRAEVRKQISRPPRSFLNQLFFDTILHDSAAIEFMAAQVGWEQLVVGSDYPFEMGDLDAAATLQSLGKSVGSAQVHQVASENARRFLRMPR